MNPATNHISTSVASHSCASGNSVDQKKQRKNASSTEFDKYIIQNYLTAPMNTMARAIGKSWPFINRRMKDLNLEVPAETKRLFSKGNQFKKGGEAYHKGMKQTDYMSAEAIEKTLATRFRTGDSNRNWFRHPVGTIVIWRKGTRREVKCIKITESEWQELQLYNWEKQNGPVPSGYLLCCKTKDRLNPDPSNWELLTARAFMLKNSSAINLSDGYVALTIVGRKDRDLIPELLQHKGIIEVKRQSLILNRTINEHSTIQK